ncbi:sodium-dependent nutrient amino acid transporter 1-like [Dermacentor andersoni]|uniref:sodium-dependent nutrient amino acid transporter 1-like n=1 Tax=Dermacentor andersoni TaxID=34620 RepID=UPI002155D4D4|nr:sodium-dependent nutrient amino acid transporter 1-like [Dermacentor andersoni]
MVELDRAEWAEKTDLFLLFITATVGLGNVYAFPYAIYTNGFGAYLILYVLFMVVVGQPLYLLEAIMGQFSSCGPLHVFACFPLAKGLGLSMCMLAAMRIMDAGLVLTQGMLYWVGSFTPRMPWMTCDAGWGADLATCYVRSTGIRLCEPALEGVMADNAALNLTDENRLHAVPMLYHGNVVLVKYEYYVRDLHGCVLANQSSAEQYYTNHILNKGLKTLSRDLVYCSAAVWLLIFLASLNIRTFMWLLRLVAPSPLVILTLFLFFTMQKSGAILGIFTMLHVRENAFYDLNLWHNAAADVLGSLGIATGAIFVFGSFNPLRTPLRGVVQSVIAMDIATSMVSACLMFSVLGNLAFVTGQATETYIEGGSTKMFFMLISEYIGEANYPQLFASLFTLTLLQLGLCQAVAGVWMLVTSMTDEFPSLRPLTGSLIAAVCMVGCVASVPYATPYGYVIALLVNRFAVQIPVLLVACLETLSFVWGYGVDRLLFDVNFMEQGMLSRYWIRCWSLWTPCALLGVVVATFATLQDFVKELEVHHDVQAKLACQFLLIGSLAGIPVLLITWLLENNLDVNLSLLPCAHWGPREALYFRAYHEAIKHSDLPAQKKVHKTDRKETVAERFTLYLVRHSPKYMGRFIKGTTTSPAKILFTRRVRDPFPCE